MDWDALGAIGELVGAVAVLITVGYLAVQIRQNTRALESAAINSLRDVHVLTENNEHYNSLVLKSLRNEALTDEERLQMVERFYTIMKGFEVLWLQQQVGAVSHDQFDQHLDIVRWALTAPVSRRMWAELKSIFAPGFQAAIQTKVLAEDAPASQMVSAMTAIDGRAVATREGSA